MRRQRGICCVQIRVSRTNSDAQAAAILKGAGSSRRNALLTPSGEPATGKQKGALSERDAETC